MTARREVFLVGVEIIGNKMEKEILIDGNLHIYDALWSQFKPEGTTIHVEEDVFIHRNEDDFIYPATDTFIEDVFEKYDVKDIIAYSAKFKKNQH